jgi:hypothetical protein
MTFEGRAPLLCSLLPKGIVAFTASGAALAILAEARYDPTGLVCEAGGRCHPRTTSRMVARRREST